MRFNYEQGLIMKIFIPTNIDNPNKSSQVSKCLGEAKSFIEYDTVSQKTNVVSVPLFLRKSRVENNEINSKKHGQITVVANNFCNEVEKMINLANLDAWQCGATTVRDAINIFTIGGSFTFKLSQ
ncbi:MAG: hypothetical protein ACXAC2_12875, partial [Candidatus Kariarchaeaceae archaeon]